MPDYLYRITPARAGLVDQSTPEEQAIIGQHFAWLQEKTQQGIVLLVGRTQNTGDDTFGIIIFRAESDEAAQAFSHQDPAVVNGVMNVEIFPYRVALLADMTIDAWRAVSG